MRNILVLPVPFDDWETFQPFVSRFSLTFREHPPTIPYELWAVCCWGEPTDSVRSEFYGIKTKWFSYYGNGCDFGAAQYAAGLAHPEDFMVFFTSRCYFHAHGWLERYLQAREIHGPQLFGASASFESNKAHICTRAYAMDAGLFKRYPHVIDSREKGQKIECGEWCLTDWCRDEGRIPLQVTFDGEQQQEAWRRPENIFRRGDQSNMLVWDKHTELWQNADDAEKVRLTDLANPVSKA